MSLSVYKWDSLQTVESSILSNRYFSDVNGFIDSPGYYFSDTATAEITDNLMLTKGWRQFQRESVASNARTSFQYPLEFQGHLIPARVVDILQDKGLQAFRRFFPFPVVRFNFM